MSYFFRNLIFYYILHDRVVQVTTLYNYFIYTYDILFVKVVKGADRNVDFRIDRPDGIELESHLWTSQGYTDKRLEQEGIHE